MNYDKESYIKKYADAVLNGTPLNLLKDELISAFGEEETKEIIDLALDSIIESHTKDHLPPITKSASVPVKNETKWAFYTFNPETGKDVYKLFNSKEEAIMEAQDAWHRLTAEEKQEFYKYGESKFCVSLVKVTTFREGDSYVDLSDINPVWNGW